jgi:hypothetical protein
MFKLIRLNDDDFAIERKGRVYRGNRKRTLIIMLLIGVNEDEITRGITSLENNNHRSAEYGINNTFIFSK